MAAEMRYCTRCILPDTRPGLTLGPDGVCNACRSAAQRPHVDWRARRAELERIAERARHLGRERGTYDCVVPVSGGKDSTWQVVTCLELGLRVLAVTWRPPGRTELGQQNLDNLVSLGVDHLDFTIAPDIERRFMRAAFERLGSSAIPMHLALFALPMSAAMRWRVPLVVWGENSATEYGGRDEDAHASRLDAAWIARYGATHGTTATDWLGAEGLSERDLVPYRLPDAAQLADAGVDAIFLGHFLSWDAEESLRVAEAHGFRRRAEGPRTGRWDYADVDDEFISVHHWLKWHKFGFTRSWDNLSVEIRRGRSTREQAIEWLAKRGDERPTEDIRAFCRFVERDEAWFESVCERFRNRELWRRDGSAWTIPGFLIPGWRWTPEREMV